MANLHDSLSVAASGMRAQSSRLRLTSENLANADTPGYRRKMASFEQVMNAGRATGEVKQGRTNLDQADLLEVFDPSHPMSNEAGYYSGSNVNMMIEIADAREAQRSYEANLKMFEQVRKMSTSLLDLLRR